MHHVTVVFAICICSLYVCVCMRLYTEVCGVCQVCKRPAVCTEVPRSQKMPSVSVASTAGREDVCEETSTRADSHSGIQDVSEFSLRPSLCRTSKEKHF